MRQAVGFSVVELPAPQGSKKGYVRKGRVVLVESSAKVRPWRQAVIAAAVDAMGDAGPLAGPLEMQVVFYLPRPKAEPKRRRTWPERKPDLDKLVRSTFDAMTIAGVWGDDAQVVRLRAVKDWAVERPPGALIVVQPAEWNDSEAAA